MSSNSNGGKCLVVGASGQVGHQLALTLGTRALPASRVDRGPEWCLLDLAVLARNPVHTFDCIERHSIEAVYCAGGATDVEGCESDPSTTTAVNCDGPVALAAASRHIPFVYFSTEYVFDGVEGPYDERSVARPISVYGRSKYIAEQRIFDVHPNPLIVRTTVVYGPDPGEKNFLYTLRRVLDSGKTIRVPTDQTSTPTFNVDLAAATIALVKVNASGIFNVCGLERMSRYDFAIRAANLMRLDKSAIRGITTSELNQKAHRPLDAGLSTEKLRTQLPDFCMRTIEEGIRIWIAEEVHR